MKSEPEKQARGTPEAPTIKGWVRCSESPYCRYPGRIWLPGMHEKSRICVEHFASDPRKHAIENWNLGLVHKTP